MDVGEYKENIESQLEVISISQEEFNILIVLKVVDEENNIIKDDFSRLIINNFYCPYIDLAISAINSNDNNDYIKHIANLYIDLVNERKAKRIEMYENSKKLWDSIETDVNIINAKK